MAASSPSREDCGVTDLEKGWTIGLVVLGVVVILAGAFL